MATFSSHVAQLKKEKKFFGPSKGRNLLGPHENLYNWLLKTVYI